MATYMIQASYTAQAWAAMSKNPQDRSGSVAKLMEALGGQLQNAYFTMGDYDIVLIFEVPDDNASMAGVIAAVSAGHLKATKTTKLLSMQDGVEAMRRAGQLVYTAPQG